MKTITMDFVVSDEVTSDDLLNLFRLGSKNTKWTDGSSKFYFELNRVLDSNTIKVNKSEVSDEINSNGLPN